MITVRNFLFFLLIIALTLITQVGGLILILSMVLARLIKWRIGLVFPILYLLSFWIIVPNMAKLFGREKLPVYGDHIQARNWAYALTFRNYVSPELKSVLIQASQNLKQDDITITYLDANFPFFDGFLLFPHLSHDDGNKIDLSLLYVDKSGTPTKKKPSVSGYGAYALEDQNYTARSCMNRGHWQYESTRFMTLGIINRLELDQKRTAMMIRELISHSATHKVFIEPHLKYTLNLGSESKVGFHGCQAVRHDDHVHLQVY